MIGFFTIALILLLTALVAPFAYLRPLDTSPPHQSWPKPWHTPAW